MRKRIYNATKYTDLKEMLKKTGEKIGDEVAYLYKTEMEDEFRTITHKEFRNDIEALGTKLINMGLKDKKVAVIGENRYEWGVTYFAVITGTGVVVPIDKSLPENEIENLIIRSGVEAIIYSETYNNVMDRLKEQGNTKIKNFISMDIDKEENGILSISELIKSGKGLLNSGNTEFLNAKIENKEMAVMLFTSGTTSASKAVMLSHDNICSNLYDIDSVIKVKVEDRFLSFLPLHHTFECTVGFILPISKGSKIAFCEGIKYIGDNLKEFKITAIISVPLLFENMYKKLIKGIESKGKMPAVQKGIKISKILGKIGIDVRRKIFKDIHANLGGNLRLLVSGGAALDPQTEKGFNQLGFDMYQGYGLTESSPVIAAEDDKNRRVGSIGKAFPSLDVRIDEPNEHGIGELLVKGPTVMLGYYQNEEATKETIIDGWLHTGDLARIDKDGYIFISGRKKFVIVLKNGKNIYPEEIEILINKIEGVKESFVYGKLQPDGDYKIAAKIVYNAETALEVFGTENEEEIKEKIIKEVKITNKLLPAYKYVRDIIVTNKELIKTTTQKVKRFDEMKVIEANNN